MEFQRESTPEERSLKRWKSLESLINLEDIEKTIPDSPGSNGSRLSESSIEICYIYDSDSKSGSDDGKPSMGDSGIHDSCHLDVLQNLEMKIDKLSDIIQEQSNQLASFQENAGGAAVSAAAQRHAQVVADAIVTVLTQRLELPEASILESNSTLGEGASSRVRAGAQALLDALENHKMTAVDKYIRTALTEFLQSEDLRELMVSATTNSIQALIQSSFAADVTATYLPMLERSQIRLLRQTTAHLDEAFRKIEAHATNFSRSTFKMGRFIRSSLERHQRLAAAAPEKLVRDVRNSVQGELERELKQWREQVLGVMKDQTPRVTPSSPLLARMIPLSPPQPIEPGKSPIDQLMSAAEINNKMKDGDVNGSFERALSAADLALVMAACHAADPARVFAAPCQLEQPVLLSLAQQLATDMVHDTQLKCRYLEDSIMHLDTENPVIQKHLHSVIEDICSHLEMFLKNYPSHMSSRRIKMIIMAAGGLVNNETAFKHPISNTYVS